MFEKLTLTKMARDLAGHAGARMGVIARNVANADTPGFVGRDLKPFSFTAQVQAQAGMAMVTPAQTAAGHMPGLTRRIGGAGAFRSVAAADSETTLDGNGVVLEDQMIKMGEARMEYEAAIGFYQKSMALLRMATRPPGR